MCKITFRNFVLKTVLVEQLILVILKWTSCSSSLLIGQQEDYKGWLVICACVVSITDECNITIFCGMTFECVGMTLQAAYDKGGQQVRMITENTFPLHKQEVWGWTYPGPNPRGRHK
jgi:hypothetical protein